MFTRTIIDQHSDHTTTVDQHTETDTLTNELNAWFEDAPQEVTDAITELADLLTTGGTLSPDADELAAYLGLKIN